MNEKTYGVVKQGIVKTFRYPWGSNKGASAEAIAPRGEPNTNGIETFPFNFYTLLTSVEVLRRNEKRRFLQIQNMAVANDIVFQFGGNAALLDGTTLTPGQVEIFDVACPVASLNIIGEGLNDRVSIIEGY